MFLTFKINNSVRKILTTALITFISGFIISVITISGNKDAEKGDINIANSIYYKNILNWIQLSSDKEKNQSNNSLKGIKVFLVKENEFFVKNIIKLYFCNEPSND